MKPQTENLTVPYSTTSGPGNANSRLEAALAYADFGWRVIPLHSPLPGGGCTCGKANCGAAGKHPRIAAWQRDASVDPERIRAWWKQWPVANVGLLMGQEAGVIAIDVDPRNGGSETLNKLTSEYGALPNTVTALTGGGGVHFLFAAPNRPVKKNSNGDTLGPGVDLQGEGSLIVAAPSLHKSGGVYEWASGCAPWECELAPLPAWVLALVDARQQQQRRVGKATRATLPDEIWEGERDDRLFRWACGLRAKGLEEDEILEALIKENEARCKPKPLPDEQVRKIAGQAAKYEPGEAAEYEAGQGAARQSVASKLVALAKAEVVEFWHTPEDEEFATVRRDGHVEHWPLGERAFRYWLARRYYEQTGCVAKDSALKEALNVLLAEAGDGPQERAYTRVAGHDGAIYLDLADDKWRAVRIDAKGWEVVSNPPVRFRRSRGQLVLPTPERGGNLDELRRFINVTEDDWPLVAAWVLFALRHSGGSGKSGSYPVLILGGQQGSAKSTTSSVLKCLIDPHDAELRSTMHNERDLAVAARRSWVIALDNLSVIQEWMSNALCRLASGYTFTTRALYTDGEEVMFRAKRPVVLNGIGDLATRSDLLERALLITCPRISDKARKNETEFWDDFEAAQPRLLGAVLDALARTLAAAPNVKLDGKPRMADFATFATAAARAGVFDEEAFWSAYNENQENAHAIALEGSPVAEALMALIEDQASGEWKGTPSALLAELRRYASEEALRPGAGWPQKPRGLTAILKRLEPNLRAIGYDVDWRGKSHGSRITRITRIDPEGGPVGGPVGGRLPSEGVGSDGNRPPQKASNGAGLGQMGACGAGCSPNFIPSARGEKEGGEGEERGGVKNRFGTDPTDPTDPPNGAATPGDADAHQDPVKGNGAAPPGDDVVDDEEIDTCTCGRPADRYTPDGEPFCNECGAPTPGDATSGQEEAPTAPGPGDAAKPQNPNDGGPHPAFLSWCDEIRAKAEAYRAGKAKLQSTRQDDEDDLF